MPRHGRLTLVLFALLLFVPSLLCVTAPSGGRAKGAARRIAGVEGLHCFCHRASQNPGASLSRAEARAARALYFATAAPSIDPGPGTGAVPDAENFPPDAPSPEPATPPPDPIS